MPTSQSPHVSPCKTLFWSLFFLISSLGTVIAAPELSVDEDVVDFGTRKTGEKIQHTFRLENIGDEPLSIKGIRASCGCTTPTAKRLDIPPGNTADLDVVIDLKGRKGRQNQFISFSTNDPDQKTVSLKLHGVAIAEIEVEPRTLNLGQIDPAKNPMGEIHLRSTTKAPFSIVGVRSQKDAVDLTFRPSENNLAATIEVRPKPVNGDGRFTDVVIVDTDHPEIKNERILVMWQRNTGVTVAPSTVNLVVPERPQLLNRYLMVKGYPEIEAPLEVTKVSWPEHEEVELVLTDTKRFGWRIHLKNFVPTAGMDDSELVIETNAGGFETLRVPVRVLR